MSIRVGRAMMVVFATLGLLQGCGGGGSASGGVPGGPSGNNGGSSPTAPGDAGSGAPPSSTPQSPATQTLVFADSGPINKVFGDPVFTNAAAGGDGTGAITYASSNTAIAGVDTSTGTVTLVTAGTAEITANKAADSAYAAAQASYTVNVSKAPQTVAFRQPGPLRMKLGDAGFTNQVSASAGTGTVLYVTADPAVATVDASTGKITAKGLGTTQITATKAEDSNYLAAQASFTVNVLASVSATFTASIGVSDTQLSFPAVAVGDQLIRSIQQSCDITAPLACQLGRSDTLTAAPFLDTNAQLGRVGWYWLTNGTDSGKGVPVTASRFWEMSDRQLVNFDGRLWLLGGDLVDNAVWSSPDGRAWTSPSPFAQQPFTQRSRLQSVVFNDKLWVIGGWGGPSKLYNDVWSSTDGTTWTQVTAAAAFPYRIGHQVVSFNNQMWLIGGENSQTLLDLNDVWSSADGVTWTLVTAHAPFGARKGHSAVVFNGRIWVIGGESANTYYNDVWSSADGVNWTNTTAPFDARTDQTVVVYGNALWVIGGGNGSKLFNDVWSSTDGTNWTQVSQSTAFSARQGMAAAIFAGKLWVVGGDESINVNCCDRSDVWSTSDGISWTYENAESPFQPASPQHAMQLNNQLWMVTGQASNFPLEVWSSGDGDTWTRATAAAAMPIRGASGTASFAGRMWVVGGRNGINLSSSMNDVWSSANGADWTQSTPAAAFSPRSAHQLVGFHGRLRLIGGLDYAGNPTADIWSSADGVTWTQDVVAAPFGVRDNHQVVEFNDMLWLVGGSATSGSPPTDVWSSPDGVTWTNVTSAPGFGTRSNFQLLAANGQLWVIGGYRGNSTYSSDVWSSTDGAQWTQVTAAAAFEPRARFSSGTLNGRLLIFGGDDGILSEQRANAIWSSVDGAQWRLRYQNQIELP